jgi:hypothetical protein
MVCVHINMFVINEYINHLALCFESSLLQCQGPTNPKMGYDMKNLSCGMCSHCKKPVKQINGNLQSLILRTVGVQWQAVVSIKTDEKSIK